jgi:putative transposase
MDNSNTDGKRLTMMRNNRRIKCDAANVSVLVSIRSSLVQWSAIDCSRECGASTSASCVPPKRKRPVLTTSDRMFWCALAKMWGGWRDALMIVQPETVLRWQRERFRRFWAGLSQPKRRRGRPCIPTQVRRLILEMASENPLWRAPRIHGELRMLGIDVSERTVSRILRTLPRRPSQSWKTFLSNHIGHIASVDFFTVPTITLKVLFVFVVIAHPRREALHFNVTEHPTAEWIAQQVVEACAYRDAPKYLIRDRDRVYGAAVCERLQPWAFNKY